MLYYELANSRPIFYSGSTVSDQGHAFICDGYRASDGFMHINWGWGGYCDGYFAMVGTDALCPSGSGIGGGKVGEGYNVNQSVVVGIMPDTKYSEVDVCMVSRTVYSIDYSSATRSTNVLLKGEFFNNSITTVDVECGVKFVSTEDDSEIYYQGSVSGTLSTNTYYSKYSFNAYNVLRNGSYYVYPIYRPKGTLEWRDMRCLPNQNNVIITITGDEPRFVLTNPMSIPKGNVTKQGELSLSFTIKALEDVTSAQVVAFVFPVAGGSSVDYSQVRLTMSAGQERNITMSFSNSLVLGNEYYLQLRDYVKGTIIGPESCLYFTVVDEYPTGTRIILTSPDELVDVYTLGGVKVRSSVRRADAKTNLEKGIYIIGGVKCIVR